MSEFSRQITDEANRLPTTDPRRNLALALGNLVDRSGMTNEVVQIVLNARTQFTPEHLPPLVFSTLQYLAIKEGTELSTFATKTQKEWELYIEENIKSHVEEVKVLLKEKNVQSFILRRYFPVKLLARIAYGNKPISILDIGCSLNLGLMAVVNDKSGEMFPGIISNEVPKNLYAGQVNLTYGLGIDLIEPDKEWVKACIWPGNEEERELIDSAYSTFVKHSSNLTFRKLDALTMGILPELQDRFDIVVASGMIYQLQPELKSKFLDSVVRVSKSKSFLLVNDYPPNLNAKDPFTYSTDLLPIKNNRLQKSLNLLRTESPFYKHIRLGDSFEEFIRRYS